MRSMTHTSTGPLVESSLSPSCSWTAVKIVGAFGSTGGGSTPGGSAPRGRSGANVSSKSQLPASPVRSITVCENRERHAAEPDVAETLTRAARDGIVRPWRWPAPSAALQFRGAIPRRWLQRWTRLSSRPRHDEGVDIEVARLGVHREREAIGEQRPHRQHHRIGARPWGRRGWITFHLGNDVETIVLDPIRVAGQLKRLQLISERDQKPRRYVHGIEAPAWLTTDKRVAVA